jgi:hypothetical protein
MMRVHLSGDGCLKIIMSPARILIVKELRTFGPVLRLRKLVNKQVLGEIIAHAPSLPPHRHPEPT